MSVENPTADAGGASITERLENYLAAGEETTKPEATGQQAAPEVPEGAETTASDDTQQPDETQLSLSDVAKVLGIDETALDVDEDGGLKIKTKVDGKEGAAKFAELLKSYQLQGHVDAKAREAAEIHRQAQERAQQFEAYAQAKAQEFAQVFQAAQQVVQGEFAGINWDDLARNDPVGYVEKRHQWEARMGQLNQLQQQANWQAQNFMQAQQQRVHAQLSAEAQRLSTLIPEWADEKVSGTERAQMREWLAKKGASPQAIESLRDAGLVAALRAGMLAEAGKTQQTVTEKKVRAAPKLVKPGQSVAAQDRNSETLRGLKENIRKSGGKHGIAEYLLASGKV